MIIEIPSADDFRRASIDLLNLVWSTAIGYLNDCQDFEEFDDHTSDTFGDSDTTWTPEERATTEVKLWQESQVSLANAFSLIQQAIEMGFKARIAEVSPFLLIARDARDYPAGSTKKDIPFSAFRSLDAADLMRVHNTVCREKLSDQFGNFWDSIRRRRNVLIHSVVLSGELIKPQELLEHVLIINKAMHPGETWFNRRLLHYKKNYENTDVYMWEYGIIYADICNEFYVAFNYLPKKMTREIFGFDHRARSYMCFHCFMKADSDCWYYMRNPRSALLTPNSKQSTSLLCTMCGQISAVIRRKCCNPSCKSTVLCNEGQMCLLCGEEQT